MRTALLEDIAAYIPPTLLRRLVEEPVPPLAPAGEPVCSSPPLMG